MAYYTRITDCGATNLATGFSHNLSLTAADLAVRPIIRQALLTCTAPLIVVSVGTNRCTVASGVGTLVTFDLEVQFIHSLVR